MKKTISYLLPFALFASILVGCSDDDSKGDNYNANYLPSIDASNLPAGNQPMTMFEDDEKIRYKFLFILQLDLQM
jgi:hypothetical protein